MTAPKPDMQTTLVPTDETNDWKRLLERWEHERGARWLPRIGKAYVEGILCIAVALMGIGSFVLFGSSAHSLFLALGAGSLTIGSCLLIIYGLYGRGLTTTQRQIIADLEKVEDAQAVGPLLQALDAATTEPARMALMNVLSGLLPHLTEMDRSLLTPTQVALLYGAIHSPPQITHPNPTFVLAAIAAIASVGDMNALPILARIIVKDAPTRGEQEAREQARLSLHQLMQTLSFGAVHDIPAWVAQLPIYSENSGARYPSGINREQGLIALFALTRLLPQLKPDQTALLSRDDRTRIVNTNFMLGFMLMANSMEGTNNIQSSRLGADFKLAVITALRNIGTGEDAGHIRHWAYGEAPSEADRYARDMAREVLPILEARREKEQAGLTLLRGASAPPTAPDQLLRPARSDSYTAQNAHPEELLHPRSKP